MSQIDQCYSAAQAGILPVTTDLAAAKADCESRWLNIYGMTEWPEDCLAIMAADDPSFCAKETVRRLKPFGASCPYSNITQSYCLYLKAASANCAATCGANCSSCDDIALQVKSACPDPPPPQRVQVPPGSSVSVCGFPAKTRLNACYQKCGELNIVFRSYCFSDCDQERLEEIKACEAALKDAAAAAAFRPKDAVRIKNSTRARFGDPGVKSDRKSDAEIQDQMGTLNKTESLKASVSKKLDCPPNCSGANIQKIGKELKKTKKQTKAVAAGVPKNNNSSGSSASKNKLDRFDLGPSFGSANSSSGVNSRVRPAGTAGGSTTAAPSGVATGTHTWSPSGAKQ